LIRADRFESINAKIKNKHIVYIASQLYSFGEITEQIWLLKNLFYKHPITIITFPLQKLRVNKALFNIVTRGINIVHTTDYDLVWFSHDKKGSLTFDSENLYINSSKKSIIRQFSNTFQHSKPHFFFSLSQLDHKRGVSIKEQYNIPQDAKIVTLHIREPNYRRSFNVEEDASGPFRNADPANYISAIKYLISKNYFVVRIGDKYMTRLNINSSNYIETPFNKFYSDIVDIYFIAVSTFFLCSASGPINIAESFGVPFLATNFWPYHQLRCWSNDMFLFKKYFSKQLQRELSYEEILSSPALYFCDINHSNKYDFEIIENTSSEILDYTKEMILRLENKAPHQDLISKLRNHFIKVQQKALLIQQAKNPFDNHYIPMLFFVNRNNFPFSIQYLKNNPSFLGHYWEE